MKEFNADELDQVARKLTDHWADENWGDEDPSWVEEKLKSFNLLCGLVILLNAAVIGAETEVVGRAGPGGTVDQQLSDIFWWGN